MKPIDSIQPQISIVFAELLPVETAEMQACEDAGMATLDRVEKMKFNAMLQGYDVKFSAKDPLKTKEARKKFAEPKREKKIGLESVKLEPLKMGRNAEI